MLLAVICIAKSGSADNLETVRAYLQAWQKAWESKDIEQYQTFYSKDIRSQGLNYQDWMKRKAKYFQKPGDISVEISELEIIIEEDHIIAWFIQRYHSPTFEDVGSKELILVKADDMFQIKAERFSPLTDDEALQPSQDQTAVDPLPAQPPEQKVASVPDWAPSRAGKDMTEEDESKPQSPATADKLAVIKIIEDDLAQALTIRRAHDSLDFGTLDMIYPDWHKGEPAEARRQWTFHGYQTYEVKYRAHSVHVEQPGIMTVRGKKRIKLARLITFWIFPPEVKWETFQTGFVIKCRLTPTGEWIIVNETSS